jgi:hypothetical protein
MRPKDRDSGSDADARADRDTRTSKRYRIPISGSKSYVNGCADCAAYVHAASGDHRPVATYSYTDADGRHTHAIPDE